MIRIVGGGPAGAAAAIAARGYDARVVLAEKSRVPHHKVCGEFIAPEACRVLRQIEAWEGFLRCNPSRLERCRLRFGKRTKQWRFDEPAYGLSRLELDRLLLQRAEACGAAVSRGELWQGQTSAAEVVIQAAGRARRTSKPGRLYGFKSHFDGPVDDTVELFFGPQCYIGVSAIENGITNVCGLASEAALSRYSFHFDDFVHAHSGLSERLKPLTRRMAWLATGPVVFSRVPAEAGGGVYPAGDALGFVDPFTGSGILNALLTGRLAGAAAAQSLDVRSYLQQCRKLMRGPFTVSAILRTVLDWGCAAPLAALAPGSWIYRLTRAASRIGPY